MEIIENNKGGQKLCLEGYMYTKKLSRGATIRWQCSRKTFFNCLGAISTNIEITEIKCLKEHNYVSEPEEIAKAKVLNEMKKTAILSSTAKPSQIYADALSGLDEEDRANVGHKDHVTKTIRNQRRKNIPIEPSNTEFKIPKAWQMREGNENVIIYDSGANPFNRIIVFSTFVQL
ncbi:hypothetical protein HELRODRAFT_158911 [Helobdella robusta]|uniref:FLYWCH-type domain-containing protein n=1 Tax=Helobdella robusta TaxID=6412 RepID=T1ENE2_HELRO|nr:hypothetical protein HELRODRAFT_158911 [Helobdella robusta]ESO12394.1 hypothetical protein HELRODRAFT_158911 [Helobdella robusta]